MDAVGKRQRRMVGEEFFVVPGITVGCRDGAVRVPPIAIAPITRRVTNACVAHSSGKNVGLCLQVHGHETTIRGPQTTYLLVVDKWVLLAELLGTLNDVLCGVVTIGIHVAGGKFLSEARATRGLNHIHYIAHSRPSVEGIIAVEIAPYR